MPTFEVNGEIKMGFSVPRTSSDYDHENSSLFSAESTFTSPDTLSLYYSIIDSMNRSTSTSLTDEITNITITTEDPSVNYTGVLGAKVQFQLYDYIIPPVGVIILLLNLAVVISSGLILKRGAEPRTTYLFLGNVAMADLITSVAILVAQLYPREHRNDIMCMLQMGLIVSSTLASIWSVLLIGIDRFCYIVHALKYQLWLTSRRARWLILCTWILGLIIGFMPAMGWKGWTNGGKYCWFIRLAPHGLVLLTGALGFLPIVIITVLYMVILYQALRKVVQLQKSDHEASIHHVPKDNDPNSIRIFRGGQNSREHNAHNKNQHSPKKSRAIIIVVLTTGSFILTWVPYFVASTMYVFCEKRATDVNTCKPLRLAIASPLAILGFMNSLLNPLIYAWWHKGFRKYVFTKIVGTKQNRNRLTKNKTSTSSTSTKTTRSSTSTVYHSRPTSINTSSRMSEGPYIGDNEDTHL